MDTNVPVQSVNAEEFLRLALSRQNLQRADDHANGVKGLLDVDQRVRYVITESLLFAGAADVPLRRPPGRVRQADLGPVT